MDKTVASLLGAMGAVAVASNAHAATGAPIQYGDALRADTYADLLKPIPNALEILNARSSEPPAQQAEPEVMAIQYYRHHHHHHHRFYRPYRYARPYYPHHHHHHAYYGRPGPGPGPFMR